MVNKKLRFQVYGWGEWSAIIWGENNSVYVQIRDDNIVLYNWLSGMYESAATSKEIVARTKKDMNV